MNIFNLKLKNKLKKTTNSQFLVGSSILFYLILLTANPSNKMIILLAGLLFIILFQKIKNIRTTLICCFFIYSVILTGKRYDFIIIPPEIFSIDFYPLGYYVSAIISPSVIISFVMAIIIIREWIKGNLKNTNIIFPDILLIVGTCLRFLSDFFISPMQNIGIILWIFSLPNLIAYFFIRLICRNNNKVHMYCFLILSSLILIESLLAISQFIHRSPLGLSIEIQKNIESFGEAADEYAFRFRPVGTFDHANMLGAYMAIYIPVLIYLLTLRISIIKQTILFFGLITLGLTLSRSAWIGICAGFLWQISSLLKIIKNSMNKLHTISVVLVCLLLCAFFVGIIFPRISSSFFSLSDTGGMFVRTIQTSIAWRLIVRSPLLGTGTAMSVPMGLSIDESGLLKYFPSPVHNQYVLLAAENGIFALLFYVLFLISSVVVLYRITKRKSIQKKGLWFIYAGSVTAIILIGFFQPYDLEMNAAFLFALIYNYVTKNKKNIT